MPAIPRPNLLILLVATVAALTVLLAPAHASAATVRTTSPVAGASVVGSVKWAATTDKTAREVRFLIDGQPRWTEYNAPYTFNGEGYLDTTGLSTGAHKLTVRALFGKNTWATHTITVYVSRPAQDTAAPDDTDTVTTTPGTTTTTETTTTETTTITTPALGDLLFGDLFDQGRLDNFTAIQAVSSDRIQPVTAPAGRAGAAARFEVRYGDHVNGETPSRAELSWSGRMAAEGDTWKYSWSTYFPSDYAYAGGWQTTTQWKGEGAGSPPLEMGISGSEFGLWSGPQDDSRKLWAVPIERGKWLDISARVHFSETPSQGWIELSYKGQIVLPRTSLATLIAGKKNYFKFGLYRQGTIQQTGVLYHAGLRIARAA